MLNKYIKKYCSHTDYHNVVGVVLFICKIVEKHPLIKMIDFEKKT